MIDFSWSHILIVLIVALVVVGPKDLPRLMNMAGKWAGKARAMANDFKSAFDDMARQSELDELRAEVERLRTNDPIADLHKDVNQSLAEIGDPLKPAMSPSPVPTEAPAPRSGEYQIVESAVPATTGNEPPPP